MSLERSLGKSLESPWSLGIIAVTGIVVLYMGYKAVKGAASAAVNAGAGLLTGDNAITQNQTDASGNPVTAYEGAGVAGTLGAAANSVSGGTLASLGDWIGGKVYDLFNGSSTPAASSSGQTSTANASGTTPSQSNWSGW